MRTVEACNEMIMNISDRDRSDLILYPLMIAVVLFSYIAIQLYYVITLFSEYGSDVPYEQMFGVLALMLIGISLLLAIFYLLMVRNSNHSKRESQLRKALIDYVDANSVICGSDLSKNVKQLLALDAKYDKEENLGSPKRNIIWMVIPALGGFLMMWIPSLREYAIAILATCFVLCVLIALVVMPGITTFASKHDKRTKEFTDAFVTAYKEMGHKLVPTSKTVGFRSFPLFAILTIITVGFFAIYWVYKIFDDMNRHFMEQWRFEDRLLRSVRDNEVECLKQGGKGLNYVLEDHWL